MIKRIIFATSNEGKVVSAQKYVDDVQLIYYKYEFIEPRSESLEEIAKYKVIQAYEEVRESCIAVDSGFYIESLNGWPGTLVNPNLTKLKLEGIIKLLSGIENRKAYFIECLAYYDGYDVKYFYGELRGTIAQTISELDDPKQWSSLWRIFIPRNHNKTMADMTSEERNNRKDGHTSSFKEFNAWGKQKKLVRKKETDNSLR